MGDYGKRISGGPAAGRRESVRQVEPPPSAVTLSTLSRVDYADCFLLDVAVDPSRSGTEWARSVLEGAPEKVRGGLRKGWIALGLELAPTGAEDCVLGWHIRHSDAEFTLLGVDSRIGMPAELLFRPESDTLLFATFVRHGNIFARAVWAGIGPKHRQVVPRLLAAAADRERGEP